MALVIIISTGDFQIRWNVLSLLFSERESAKWPPVAFSTLERYPFATPYQNMTFFVGF